MLFFLHSSQSQPHFHFSFNPYLIHLLFNLWLLQFSFILWLFQFQSLSSTIIHLFMQPTKKVYQIYMMDRNKMIQIASLTEFDDEKGFLSLYREERYHLGDYKGRGRQLHGPKEIFDYRHCLDIIVLSDVLEC
ncbi:uncharacterized protein LOC111317783 [Durio zibethinus]|uniref:Uncharacterized protein LOC111317783 n=1 Tax=Durio zibethinus TaxID=66656 RepID=A0A6P6BFP7_DURZI|nr:uncharacterized protein LOC111317783 [Durio zibethinus]